jgi:cell division protease FtsH
MVCEWGMSPQMGPLVFGRKEHEVFLGRDFSQGQDYSERTAQEIDAEVRQIVTNQYSRARKVLEENIDKLKSIAKALLEYETIDYNDVQMLMAGKEILREKPLTRIKTREEYDRERAKNTGLPQGLDANALEPEHA